jgi:hypothetical protein
VEMRFPQRRGIRASFHMAGLDGSHSRQRNQTNIVDTPAESAIPFWGRGRKCSAWQMSYAQRETQCGVWSRSRQYDLPKRTRRLLCKPVKQGDRRVVEFTVANIEAKERAKESSKQHLYLLYVPASTLSWISLDINKQKSKYQFRNIIVVGRLRTVVLWSRDFPKGAVWNHSMRAMSSNLEYGSVREKKNR